MQAGWSYGQLASCKMAAEDVYWERNWFVVKRDDQEPCLDQLMYDQELELSLRFLTIGSILPCCPQVAMAFALATTEQLSLLAFQLSCRFNAQEDVRTIMHHIHPFYSATPPFIALSIQLPSSSSRTRRGE